MWKRLALIGAQIIVLVTFLPLVLTTGTIIMCLFVIAAIMWAVILLLPRLIIIKLPHYLSISLKKKLLPSLKNGANS